MKKIFIVLLAVLFLTGCGEEKNINQTTEENKKQEIIEVERKEGTKEIEWKENEEIKIIYNKDYELDGEKIKIILDENNKVTVFGNTKTEEKASLLLTTFTTDMYGIDYSIAVMCNDLFMTASSDATVSGKNKDGSIAYGAPDWYEFPEDELREELKNYKDEIKEIENDFLKNAQIQ